MPSGFEMWGRDVWARCTGPCMAIHASTERIGGDAARLAFRSLGVLSVSACVELGGCVEFGEALMHSRRAQRLRDLGSVRVVVRLPVICVALTCTL